jgi:hypothetical protein|tara:strand:+ start:218 stop:403 length:186 start_codon:yes stop_codon:yes gene_type:complete
MNKTKKEMIKEIMLFRYSSKDANYINPTNFEFIDYITNEYKKTSKEEIEIEYNFYLNKAYK